MNNALYNKDCPPLMSDGRLFTDYRPSCEYHNMLGRQNGITNSYDFKQMLMNNAIKLQQHNTKFYDNKSQCHSCGGYYMPDPNGAVDYWNKYNSYIGYNNTITFKNKI